MPPPLDVPIRTERLVLRAATADDAEPLHRYMSDPEVCRYLRTEPLNLDECREYIKYWAVDGVVSPQWLRLIVESEGAHAGFLSLNRQRFDAAEVGWVLGPGHRGRGLCREAVEALITLGFADLDLHRIEARVDPRNAPSIRLCESLGFRREGHLREVVLVGDERRDELVFSMLMAEWRHG